jgi:hypothetical protein
MEMKKRISERKLQANRNNAARSTGARTEAGKNRSRFNALRHGLTAKVLLTRGENEDEFREFYRRVRRELRPKGFVEEIRVEDAVVASWRLRRGIVYETAWVDQQLRDAKTAVDRGAATLPDMDTLELVARYDGKHRRDRDHALKELERLQVQRKREGAADTRRALADGSAAAAEFGVVPPDARPAENQNES